MSSDVLAGLTTAEVRDRHARGLTNAVEDTTSRSVGDIVRANVVTRFNAILGTLLFVILALREYRDALFGVVLVANAVIGIAQEVRAKQTLDRLAVVNSPRVRVVRAGVAAEVTSAEVVLDDVVVLSAGDQVPVDAVVLDVRGFEVDESLLTGESEPIRKLPGDEVLSGSTVVAGGAHVQATRVGPHAYAHRLAEEAKRFSLVSSELRRGIDTILRIVTWLMAPTALLLVTSQLAAHDSVREALRGAIAGVVAMVPEGLVLLTSVAFAVGVVRLGRRQVLTQELAAIEGLARVDIVCVDKTGTLTQSDLAVTGLEPLNAAGAVALGAVAASDPDPNGTLAAIADAFPSPEGWSMHSAVPFSSARKWSAAAFTDHGAWVLGAPDILLRSSTDDGTVRARAEELAATGRRVVLLAEASAPPTEEHLPAGLIPAALVLLEEELRPDAPDTVRYFLAQGVTVKVISGDHPRTVASVASRCGVTNTDEPLDAADLPDDPEAFADVVERVNVFGRVTPHQKKAMVQALQSRGHTVAMTGDGVNDVLALKEADVGVAMGSGSAASRAVARFVLLDNTWAVLPDVVAEGRRVIANVERVANLFVTKTVYAMLLSLAVGVAGLPFPFYPRHLTVISSLTIGTPAFFLALAPNSRRAMPGFLSRVLRFALPSGIVAAAATFAGYALARSQPDVSLDESRTTATLVLFMVAIWVLAILARPYTPARATLVTAMVAAFIGVLALPGGREYFALDFPPLLVVLAAGGIGGAAMAVLEGGWRAAGWVGRHRHGGESLDSVRDGVD